MSTPMAYVAERVEMIELARDIAKRELIPRAEAIDAGDEAALQRCWAALCEVGLDRALLAEDFGGVDIGIADLLAVIEELAVGEGGLALSALLCNVALAALPPERAEAVPVGQRWAIVPVPADADAIAPLDARAPQRVSALGLGAHGAGGIVFAFASRRAPLALAADEKRLEIARDHAQLGLRGAPAGAITLLIEGAASRTATAAQASDAGCGSTLDGPTIFALLRLGIAAIATGIARRAGELAHEYALARRQGGVPIVKHDAVSGMLAAIDARVRLHSRSRAAVAPFTVARWPGGIALDPADALAAKALAADAAVASTTDAVQVFGGTGYMRESGVEKLMRDAKCCQLFPEPSWAALDELMRLRAEKDSGGGHVHGRGTDAPAAPFAI